MKIQGLSMEIVAKLRQVKSLLKEEGFLIDGIVGSYARNEQNDESDVDILYHVEEPFVKQHRGFTAFTRIVEIRDMLSRMLGKKVDLIATRGLSQTAKRYMLDKVVHV